MKEIALRTAAKYLLIAGYTWFIAGFIVGWLGKSAPMYDRSYGTAIDPYEVRSIMVEASLRLLLPGSFCCVGGIICGLLSVPGEASEVDA